MYYFSRVFVILVFILGLSGCSSLADMSMMNVAIVLVSSVAIIGCFISSVRTHRYTQETLDNIRYLRQKQLEAAKADLRPAIDEGNPIAQYLLGLKFHTGDGVIQDYSEACYWYSLSAQGGFITAVSTLALMNLKGWGTEQDLPEAIQLLLIAAKEGDVQSQIFLAAAYLNGWGVPKNKEQAIYWLQLAASEGSEQASQLLDDLQKGIFPKQTIESLEMVVKDGDKYITLQ